MKIAGGVVGVLMAAVLLFGATGCGYTPPANEIGVVRNGGPFDNHKIRQVVEPGSGYTWVGFGSTVHSYPTSTVQRYYTITSVSGEGDRPGVDVVHVPSQDGVDLGVEGTFYLTTAFDGTKQGEALVKDFDNQFGTRQFPVAGTGGAAYAWSGDVGWSAFLDAIVRPLIDNELRQAIGSYRCVELLPSCAFVENANADVKDVAKAGASAQTNIQQVEQQIESGLASDLKATLGEPYFDHIQFRLVRVTPPDNVQTSINDVQAQRVEIAKAQAKVQQANLQAEANAKLAHNYDICKACAQIDMIKALPAGSHPNVYIGVQPVVTANGNGNTSGNGG